MDNDPIELLTAWIQHEKRVVTYVLLSRELGIHVDKARRILEEFHEKAKKSKYPVHASYIISGFMQTNLDSTMEEQLKDEQDMDTDVKNTSKNPSRIVSLHTFKFVAEENVESVKKEFDDIISMEIYSLEPNKLKDTTPIAEANSLIYTEEKYVNAFENSNKGEQYGYIVCPEIVKKKGGIRHVLVPSKSISSTTKEVEDKKLASRSSSTKEVEDKKLTSRSSSTKEVEDKKLTSRSSSTKEVEDKKLTSRSSSTTSKPITSKPTTSFWGKAGAKSASGKKGESGKSKNSKLVKVKEIKSDDEEDRRLAAATKLENGNNADGAEEEEENDEGDDAKVMARRAKEQSELEAMMLDTGKVEEDADREGESDKDIDIVMTTEDDETRKTSNSKENELNTKSSKIKTRVRKTRKVMKKKTTKNERGYLVTEDIWEIESYSEDEPDIKQVNEIKKTIEKKNGGGNKEKRETGQANLMSFFGKR